MVHHKKTRAGPVKTMRCERVLLVVIMCTSVRNMMCSPSRTKFPLHELREWRQRFKEYDDVPQTQNRNWKNVWAQRWTDNVSLLENYQCNQCWLYKNLSLVNIKGNKATLQFKQKQAIKTNWKKNSPKTGSGISSLQNWMITLQWLHDIPFTQNRTIIN